MAGTAFVPFWAKIIGATTDADGLPAYLWQEQKQDSAGEFVDMQPNGRDDSNGYILAYDSTLSPAVPIGVPVFMQLGFSGDYYLFEWPGPAAGVAWRADCTDDGFCEAWLPPAAGSDVSCQLAAGSQSISPSTQTTLQFGGDNYAVSSSFWSVANATRLTFPKTGKYLINPVFYVYWTLCGGGSPQLGTTVNLQILKNGAGYGPWTGQYNDIQLGPAVASCGSPPLVAVMLGKSWHDQFTAGDYLEVQVQNLDASNSVTAQGVLEAMNGDHAG